MGTIEPKMGTNWSQDILASALFGKTQQAVLALLLGRPDESFYLREVVRLTRAGQGAAQRELGRLVDAGIVRRSRRGRQVFFQANPDSPVFAELQGIVLKTVGVVDVIRQALVRLAQQIDFAFVYGSVARGAHREGSDLDLCVIGEVAFGEIVTALAGAQEQLAREINPTVYPVNEFSAKLAQGHHFVTALAREAKLFVIGDEGDFAGLAKQWMARAAQNKPARNRRPPGRRRSRSD